MNKRIIIFILSLLLLITGLLFIAYIKSEELNREVQLNQMAFDNYISKVYGIVKDELVVNKRGSLTDTRMRGYHGDLGYSWIREYEIRAPFMEKSFEVWVDNRTHKIFGDTFSTVLSTDVKFQHLYSEWVKKEVGIEDENVELGFAGNFDTPYIEFNKITSLSDDYREVFENTHNLYCWLCEVSNIKDLTDNNKYEIAKSIREKYLLKAINKCKMPSDKKFGGRIYLSSSENAREKGKSYVFDFDINNINDSISEMNCRKLE